MTQKLERAVIKILEGRNQNVEHKVLFNPAEYNLEIANNFQETALPGLANPILQFVNGEAQTLSMELLFDTWTEGGGEDVSKITDNFVQMLAIDADLHAPPPVEFKWGGLAFKGVVDKLSQRFTMFNSNGRPVRATLSISFKQYRPLSEQLEVIKPNSADRTKRRVFTADDSLWAMAAREYGQPRFWRVVARHNRIENPRLLKAGAVVLLPPLEDLAPLEINDESAGA